MFTYCFVWCLVIRASGHVIRNWRVHVVYKRLLQCKFCHIASESAYCKNAVDEIDVIRIIY